MQNYRLERVGSGRGGRLSQSTLLAMMGKFKAEYKDYSHSTVARWESGDIFPTRERLEIFGAALELQRPEIDGLVDLAGLEPTLESVRGRGTQNPAANGTGATSGSPGKAPLPTVELSAPPPSYLGTAMRYWSTRFALPVLVIAGVGLGLHFLDLSAPWMFGLYVAAIVVMVLVNGFMNRRDSNELRDFLFISVFFLLSAPLMQTPLTGIDSYGLFAIDGFAGTPLIYVLALIAGLLQAALAVIAFDLLWRWQYSNGRGSSKAYQRAAWVAVPPPGTDLRLQPRLCLGGGQSCPPRDTACSGGSDGGAAGAARQRGYCK